MKAGETITSEDLRRVEAQVRREAAVEAGYYDGRNAPKIHQDKKKQANKRACRGQKGESINEG